MARTLADIANPQTMGLMSLGILVFAGVAWGLRAHRKKRPTADQLEAYRREWLATNGKLGGGEILEVNEDSISYLYDIRGIGYTAAQDVSMLQDRLPADRWSIVGGVGVRYDPRNPANSIVLSETWTGLRQRNRNVS